MPLLTTTSQQAAQTISVLYRRIYIPDLQSVVFRNDRFLGMFDQMESLGDDSARWKVHTGGNTGVERFDEGQAEPAAGAQTYINADLAYDHFRGVMEISGHVRAAMKSNEAALFSALELEATKLRDDIIDQVTARMISAAGPGIELAVDSAGTYAAVDRATVAAWGAAETAIGGAFTKGTLDDLYQTLIDAERAARPTMIITSPAQVANYHQQATTGTAGLPSIQISQAPGQPATVDLGANWEQARYNGIPIFGLPDLTNTIWLMGERDRVKWIRHEDWVVKDLARVNDADRAQVSLRGVVAFLNPQKWGKNTGVTA